jgi:hypothetical protein
MLIKFVTLTVRQDDNIFSFFIVISFIYTYLKIIAKVLWTFVT